MILRSALILLFSFSVVNSFAQTKPLDSIKKLAEITKMEKDVYEYQNKIFGFEGKIFLKRHLFLPPYQY